MKSVSFSEALQEVLAEDDRYAEEAYHFVREGLDFTIKLMAKPLEGPERHVSGPELLDGMRKYGLQEYGPLAKTVLNRWGIHVCRDIGCIVFNMVQKEILGKTEEDSIDDFADVYDFDEAFRAPFLPEEEGVDVDLVSRDEGSPDGSHSRSS